MFIHTSTIELAASADAVWAHATGMSGVNYELRPLVRMTVPRWARGRSIDADAEGLGFTSYLLAGGVIPFDRHLLAIAEVGPGRRFRERSSSLVNRLWVHERSVEPLPGGGCALNDRLEVQPRVAATERLAARIVPAIFSHRHRRLVERFGAAGSGAPRDERPPSG